MKVSLNKEQLEFLSEHFDISQNDIENMYSKEWNTIREKCFDIEVDENEVWANFSLNLYTEDAIEKNSELLNTFINTASDMGYYLNKDE